MPERARYGRRDAHLAIAGAAALAGCGGGPATPTDTDSPTDSPPSGGPATPTATASPSPPASASLAMGGQFVTDAGRTVAVAEPAARRMVVDWELTDPPVRAPDGVGFLLATASTTADAYAGVAAGERQLGLYTPTHTPFSPDADGEGPQARYLNLAVTVDGNRNPAGEPFWAGRTVSGADVRRWAFPVPAEPDPSSVEVVWRRRRVAYGLPPGSDPDRRAVHRRPRVGGSPAGAHGRDI